MSTSIKLAEYEFEFRQGQPSPPWVSMEVHQGYGDKAIKHKIQMTPENFKIFASFIKSWTDNCVKLEKEFK